MTGPLGKQDVASVAVPLPSCGEAGETLGDLFDDVESCRRVIDAIDGDVVLCGHSYGGMVITEAGADERVSRLIYVTSVMPDTGQSQGDLVGAEPAPWLQPDENTLGVDPDMVRDYFLQDCDPTTTDRAVSRLTRQSLAPFGQAPREIGWRSTPASYIVCAQDLATPAAMQRKRVRDGVRRVEFDSGHHPFLSQPENFARALVEEIDAS